MTLRILSYIINILPVILRNRYYFQFTVKETGTADFSGLSRDQGCGSMFLPFAIVISQCLHKDQIY